LYSWVSLLKWLWGYKVIGYKSLWGLFFKVFKITGSPFKNQVEKTNPQFHKGKRLLLGVPNGFPGA
jgi:hypothetical protein